MRGIHMMLHNALDRAVKEKLILSNPTENCIIPKIEKQEMKILQIGRASCRERVLAMV